MEGYLVLGTGRVFRGQLRGAQKPTSGEIIFNTALTGYQEVITDPSYYGQIVTMTAPQIGNYGVNREDVESRNPFLAGFIVKELSPVVSNWRSEESLDTYLARHGVTVLEGIDTRALVTALREHGAVPGLIAQANGFDLEELRAEAASLPGMEGLNLAREVSIKAPYAWPLDGVPALPPDQIRYRVIAYDYGIKYAILRALHARGIAVEVVPFDYPAEKILADPPDGIFLSNGPGDPEPVGEAVANIRALLGKLPIFGICLGHQLLALALGAQSYKLKFGHHGGNHPVLNLASGQVEITSQNHGFAVAEESLPSAVTVTHRSLNDQTVEGIHCRDFPAFSVQYHPEASPGPHDSAYLFDQFLALMAQSS